MREANHIFFFLVLREKVNACGEIQFLPLIEYILRAKSNYVKRYHYSIETSVIYEVSLTTTYTNKHYKQCYATSLRVLSPFFYLYIDVISCETHWFTYC
jgi:hypothetical protein